MEYRIGQLVRCIDDTQFRVPPGWPLPKKGEIYEVALKSEAKGAPLHIGFVEMPPFCDHARGVCSSSLIWDARFFAPLTGTTESIVRDLLALPPLVEVDPPTKDERPME